MILVLCVVKCPQTALPVEVFQFWDFDIATLMTLERERSEPSYERSKCFLISVPFYHDPVPTRVLASSSIYLRSDLFSIMCTVAVLALSRLYFGPCSDLILPLFCFLSYHGLVFSLALVPSRFYSGLTSIRVLILSQSQRKSFALGTTLFVCILIISRLL